MPEEAPKLGTAVAWLIGEMLMSQANDAMMKWLGGGMSSAAVVSGRFICAALFVYIVLRVQGSGASSKYIGIYALKAVFLTTGICIWVYCLDASELAIACLFSNTSPMITMFMAWLFLGEGLRWRRVVTALVSFLGVVVALDPAHNGKFSLRTMLLFLTAASCFAGLECLNKRTASEDDTVRQIFWTNFFTAVIATGIVGVQVLAGGSAGTRFGVKELFLMVVLGCTANVLIFCVIQAYRLVDASALAPFKFLELAISASFGWVVFREAVRTSTILGALLIVSTNALLVKYDSDDSRPPPLYPLVLFVIVLAGLAWAMRHFPGVTVTFGS